MHIYMLIVCTPTYTAFTMHSFINRDYGYRAVGQTTWRSVLTLSIAPGGLQTGAAPLPRLAQGLGGDMDHHLRFRADGVLPSTILNKFIIITEVIIIITPLRYERHTQADLTQI